MASINRAAVAWTIGIVAFAIGIVALGDDLTELAVDAPASVYVPVTASEIDSPEIPRDIVEFNNAFAMDFYRLISDNDDNVFFSPAGVYVTLSALYEGAVGETASQIQDVIGAEPEALTRHNATAHMMASIKRADPRIALGMENALWLADRFAPYDHYTDIVQGTYLADVQAVSFPDDGPRRINDWAADKTGGRITDVIDGTDSSTSMVVTSAARFEGTWLVEFQKWAKDGIFFPKDRRLIVDGDNAVVTDVMYVASDFNYTDDWENRIRVVKMPYSGERLSMLVILPYDYDAMAILEGTISAQQVEGWLDKLRPIGVGVLMPKFEIEAEYDLVPHLRELGVTDAFEPGAADLAGIASATPGGSLHVSGATHNAYIKISEEGAEEPSFTIVPLQRLWRPPGSPPYPVSFDVQIPFLFMILDEQSGMILFMGRVMDPVPRAPAEPAISANPVMASEIHIPFIPPDIADTSNAFAFDFYRQISDGGDNVFFSPIGVYTAFSVLYEGARGNTASQIEDTFDFDSDAPVRHNDMAHMTASINWDIPHATLDMANALWLADRLAPYDSYTDIVQDIYLADAQTVSFSDDGPGRINDWTADKTGDMITDVIGGDDVHGSTAMVLTSAVYFDGAWITGFPEGDTTKREFWTDGDQSVEADFMVLLSDFDYTLGPDGTQVLKMPYEGGRLSMLLILPDERDGLAALEEKVSNRQMEQWIRSMDSQEVLVVMPKFEIKSDYDLIPHLRALGVTDAFRPGAADLAGIAPAAPGGNPYVSGATHSVYVKVSEEGAGAPAVTFAPSIPEGSSHLSFTADHPFLLIVYDEESGMILFMGRVSDPTS